MDNIPGEFAAVKCPNCQSKIDLDDWYRPYTVVDVCCQECGTKFNVHVRVAFTIHDIED